MYRTICLAAAIALTCARLASADVTVKQTTTGKGLGMNGTTQATTYIKGLKMRSEAVLGDTTRVTIFDVESQKMYSFDTKKKEADVWDMQAFAAEMNKNVDTSQLKASVTPNGQTKTVSGQTAAGYTMDISIPATMGGQGGMTMTIGLTGPLWIVKNAPGTKEFQTFYRAAVEKGWIFSDPRAAKGSPGQAKAMAEMYRQMVETGGVAYESEMQVKMSGDGPLAGLMAKMGGVTMTTTVQSVETGALGDDLFTVPAGYKLNARK